MYICASAQLLAQKIARESNFYTAGWRRLCFTAAGVVGWWAAIFN